MLPLSRAFFLSLRNFAEVLLHRISINLLQKKIKTLISLIIIHVAVRQSNLKWFKILFLLSLSIDSFIASFSAMFFPSATFRLNMFIRAYRNSWALDVRVGCWILDAGLWTLDSGRWTLNAGLWTLGSGRWNLDAGPWMLDPGRWTLDDVLWTLDSGRWTLGSGLWTLDSGLRTLDSGLWTPDATLSTLGSRHWTLDNVVDCCRTESEPSFSFCFGCKSLRTSWSRLFCREYRFWRGYF